MSLNGTLVTPSTNTYPYRAMFETLLSYGEDTVNFADAAAVNEGLAKRRTLARQSREFDMMGRLHADLFF